MSVDGSISVLKDSGKVIIFKMGKKSSEIDLGFPGEKFLSMKKTPDGEFFTLISESGKIYVFDKSWAFKERFVFTDLNEQIEDFIYNQKEAKLYLLINGLLYSAAAAN